MRILRNIAALIGVLLVVGAGIIFPELLLKREENASMNQVQAADNDYHSGSMDVSGSMELSALDRMKLMSGYWKSDRTLLWENSSNENGEVAWQEYMDSYFPVLFKEESTAESNVSETPNDTEGFPQSWETEPTVENEEGIYSSGMENYSLDDTGGWMEMEMQETLEEQSNEAMGLEWWENGSNLSLITEDIINQLGMFLDHFSEVYSIDMVDAKCNIRLYQYTDTHWGIYTCKSMEVWFEISSDICKAYQVEDFFGEMVLVFDLTDGNLVRFSMGVQGDPLTIWGMDPSYYWKETQMDYAPYDFIISSFSREGEITDYISGSENTSGRSLYRYPLEEHENLSSYAFGYEVKRADKNILYLQYAQDGTGFQNWDYSVVVLEE